MLPSSSKRDFLRSRLTLTAFDSQHLLVSVGHQKFWAPSTHFYSWKVPAWDFVRHEGMRVPQKFRKMLEEFRQR